MAEAFWCPLSLKEGRLSSGLFVFIRVHWWFVFINDRLFFLERSAQQGGGSAKHILGVKPIGNGRQARGSLAWPDCLC